jgi:hypothetical protein
MGAPFRVREKTTFYLASKEKTFEHSLNYSRETELGCCCGRNRMLAILIATTCSQMFGTSLCSRCKRIAHLLDTSHRRRLSCAYEVSFSWAMSLRRDMILLAGFMPDFLYHQSSDHDFHHLLPSAMGFSIEEEEPTHRKLPARRTNRSVMKDVTISLVQEEDLPTIAKTYYSAFSLSWHTAMEPPSQSQAPLSTRILRLSQRMLPSLHSREAKWVKASIIDDAGNETIVGCAAWLRPVPTEAGTYEFSTRRRHIMHHWRRDAAEKHGWAAAMGWSAEEVDEMWEHVDLAAWQNAFKSVDEVREKRMWGVGHWYVRPPSLYLSRTLFMAELMMGLVDDAVGATRVSISRWGLDIATRDAGGC